MEQLSQRGLEHIFTEKLFEQYKRKVERKFPYGNKYYAALAVFDMFILNAPPNGL